MLDLKQREDIENEYKALLRFYPEIKKVVILSEKFDNELRVSLPAINELRNAFDHIMRVHGVLNGLAEFDEQKDPYHYCTKNIEKAHGHLYRAGYDAFDSITISIFKKINNFRDTYDDKDIVAVFPEFYNELLPVINEAKKETALAKSYKDVESKKQEESNFHKYEMIFIELEKISCKIDSFIPMLVAYHEQAKYIEDCSVLIDKFDHNAISSAMPDFYKNSYPILARLKNKIASKEKISDDEYTKLILAMDEFEGKISTIEVHSKNRNVDDEKDTWKQLSIRVVAVVVSLVLAALFGYFIKDNSLSAKTPAPIKTTAPPASK